MVGYPATFLLSLLLGAACNAPKSPVLLPPSFPPAPPAVPAQVAGGPLTSFGDGTWEVGVDIEPGKYKTPGPRGSGCYYERQGGDDGSFSDIIDNNFAEGPATVTIKASDKFFETSGCDWAKVG